jgi:hypothetical protein
MQEDTASLTKPDGALFEVLVGTMRMVEQSLGAADGAIKKQTVLSMLVAQGLITNEQREPVSVLVDGLIWAARNRKMISTFATKNCACLPL